MKSNYNMISRTGFRTFLAAVLLTGIVNGSYAGNEGTRVPPIVSAKWLAENRTNPDIVILHVAPVKRDYETGHIPGAEFLWPGYIIISTETETTLSAPVENITKVLRTLGVNNNSHVVLCGIYGNIIPVCRVFVNLEHVGLKGRVSVLDGGFDAWKAAGYEVSAVTPVVKKGKFTATVNNNLADGNWMIKNLTNKSYSIIDARAKPLYDGTTGLPRAGHIPGAKSLPQTVLYDSKTFQFIDAEKLSEAFRNLEIPSGGKPVLYCHTGNQASVAYVAALAAGYDPVLYEGSMEEWASRFDLPVEK
jgi:thiosulfate/3-mercaptopyruvate sulfurtransferase